MMSLEKWYEYENMNIQQFSNPQFWTSLFPNWWSVIINIIDIALVAWLLYFWSRPSSGPRSWFWCVELLSFLGSIFSQFLGLTTISWLINQVITYGVIALVADFLPWNSDRLRAFRSGDRIFTTSEVSQKRKWYRPMSRQWLIWAHVRLVPW